MQTLSASGGEPPVVSGNQSLRGGVGGCGVPIGQLQSASLILPPPPSAFRQEKQLAPPAGEVPSESLFLPRHHGGHPSGVPEDGPDHVLPVDV